MIRLTLFAIFLLAALGSGDSRAEEPKRSCALGYTNSIFAPSEWPVRDLDAFANGKLGIIDSQYDHFYLFIAYRKLAGKELSKADIEQLRTFDPCWDDGTRGYHGPNWSSSPTMVRAVQGWEAARKQVKSEPPRLGLLNPRGNSALGYTDHYIPNCNADAFRTADKTLRDRFTKFGTGEWVKQWANGQDLVFEQCIATSKDFPEEASPTAPSWFRADRFYQIAAAHLYAGRYLEAAEMFDAIALDAASPWQELGSYLSARSLLRYATTDHGRREEVDALLTKAEKLLIEAKQQAKTAARIADINRLLQRIRLRTDPYGVRLDLNERLSSDKLPETIGQDVRDFNAGLAFENEVLVKNLGFAAWLPAMRQGTEAIFHNGAGIPNTELWLVASLAGANKDSANLEDLLKRALRVPKSSPAYFTVRFHIVRLTTDHSLARKITNELLEESEGELTIQDKNRLKSVALPNALTANEFARLAYMQSIPDPSRGSGHRSLHDGAPVVDEVGAKIFNEALPLSVLFSLQQAKGTPPALREELLSVVWARAFILKRWDILLKLSVTMQSKFPNSGPVLRQMDAAESDFEKTSLGALFLVRHPGLVASLSTSINYSPPNSLTEIAKPNMHRFYKQDGARDNWWCSIPSGRYFQNDPSPKEPSVPLFLSPKEIDAWRKERRLLLETPNATDYLGELVLAWASTNPKDERLPDALRMIVRSARGGCISDKTSGIGKRAFRKLHKNFPNSEAARLTHSHG